MYVNIILAFVRVYSHVCSCMWRPEVISVVLKDHGLCSCLRGSVLNHLIEIFVLIFTFVLVISFEVHFVSLREFFSCLIIIRLKDTC